MNMGIFILLSMNEEEEVEAANNSKFKKKSYL
jgi:hypothetical protein